jgi:predicted metal-dependent peptidase
MRIQEAVLQLLLKQPFYGMLAASVAIAENADIRQIEISLTPSPLLRYNRNWFESLKDDQAVGALMHELLHLILLHPLRRGGREEHLWTIACDMTVNEHIDKNLLPEDAVTVAAIAAEIGQKLAAGKSAEYYYDILVENDSSIHFIVTKKEVRIVLKSGLQLKANASSEGEASEINNRAAKSMVSELIEQAKSEGEIPGGIGQSIADIYGAAEIHWRNVLKRFLSGRGKTVPRKTCKRESKRFEGLPGTKRTMGTTALVALDESGSIPAGQIELFYHELLNIREITGAAIQVTQFDTECTEPVPLDKYIRRRERLRSGGTDFRPVFQLADRLRLPLVIVFTDGDGIVPDHANQKVLWIVTQKGRIPAGFGHCICFAG